MKPTSENFDLVIEHIVGGSSMAEIAAMEGFPDSRTLRKWLVMYPGFRQDYMRAVGVLAMTNMGDMAVMRPDEEVSPKQLSAHIKMNKEILSVFASQMKAERELPPRPDEAPPQRLSLGEMRA